MRSTGQIEGVQVVDPANGAKGVDLEPLDDALVVVNVMAIGQIRDERLVADFLVANDAISVVHEVLLVVILLALELVEADLGHIVQLDVVSALQVLVDESEVNWRLLQVARKATQQRHDDHEQHEQNHQDQREIVQKNDGREIERQNFPLPVGRADQISEDRRFGHALVDEVDDDERQQPQRHVPAVSIVLGGCRLSRVDRSYLKTIETQNTRKFSLPRIMVMAEVKPSKYWPRL